MSILTGICLLVCVGIALFSIGYTSSFRKDFEEDRRDFLQAKNELSNRSYDRDKLERTVLDTNTSNSVLVDFNKTLHQSIKEFKQELQDSKDSRARTERELNLCKLHLEKSEKQLSRTERLLEKTERQLQSMSCALEDAEIRIEALEYDNALIKQKLEISHKLAKHCKVKEPFAVII